MDSHKQLGGIGDEKPADSKIQGLCDKVKSEFEKKSGTNAAEFKAKKYASQVVAGTNYYIKVSTGDGHYCHIKIYEPLRGEPEITGFQLNKSEHDAIHFF
ncbi:cystatin-A-like [Dendropsophus ebraccatus]|uniref:cystatin-A-like n=1 Tax=Dendropsophus ebraccatus TaxID=150705 RepID=UPI003831A436